jgi:hypothetical protein
VLKTMVQFLYRTLFLHLTWYTAKTHFLYAKFWIMLAVLPFFENVCNFWTAGDIYMLLFEIYILTYTSIKLSYAEGTETSWLTIWLNCGSKFLVGNVYTGLKMITVWQMDKEQWSFIYQVDFALMPIECICGFTWLSK